MTTAHERSRPGLIGRVRSRQAGRPTGLLGRIIGRAMVKDTAQANNRNIELLGPIEGQTVIDIGFGQGRGVQLLAEAGATVLGTEVSRTMVVQAKARNRKAIADGRVDLRLSDGVTLPFDDDSADAVISAHTIYFWREPKSTLADISRVLRPGGSLILAFSSSDDGVAEWKDPDVYWMYGTTELTAMLEQVGFVDIECAGAPDAPEAMRWVRARNPVG